MTLLGKTLTSARDGSDILYIWRIKNMGNTNTRVDKYDENDKYRDGFIVLWGGLLQIQTEIQMMKITNTGGCIVGKYK